MELVIKPSNKNLFIHSRCIPTGIHEVVLPTSANLAVKFHTKGVWRAWDAPCGAEMRDINLKKRKEEKKWSVDDRRGCQVDSRKDDIGDL